MSREEVVDYRSEPCPSPVIKTIKKVMNMRSGECLVIYTDLEECVELIKNALELLSVKSIEVSRVNNYWVIRVTK